VAQAEQAAQAEQVAVQAARAARLSAADQQEELAALEEESCAQAAARSQVWVATQSVAAAVLRAAAAASPPFELEARLSVPPTLSPPRAGPASAELIYRHAGHPKSDQPAQPQAGQRPVLCQQYRQLPQTPDSKHRLPVQVRSALVH